MPQDDPLTPEDVSILVVDDNRPLADAFARALASEYEVTTAYSVADARESLDPDVDVVLLDRRLPDGSGDELLQEIRECGYECRVAVVSGAERSSELDCDAYVTKPLSGADEVRETVSELLDEHVSA
jgi:DNA-binding response OmpR family regulator